MPGEASPALPTRVIDVNAGEDGSIIRLVSSTGCRGPYISLSHVWGRTKTLTTTLATFKERSDEMAVESLPKTSTDKTDYQALKEMA